MLSQLEKSKKRISSALVDMFFAKAEITMAMTYNREILNCVDYLDKAINELSSIIIEIDKSHVNNNKKQLKKKITAV